MWRKSLDCQSCRRSISSTSRSVICVLRMGCSWLMRASSHSCPILLGKLFLRRKSDFFAKIFSHHHNCRQPISINCKKKGLKRVVEKMRDSTFFYLGKGSCRFFIFFLFLGTLPSVVQPSSSRAHSHDSRPNCWKFESLYLAQWDSFFAPLDKASFMTIKSLAVAKNVPKKFANIQVPFPPPIN